MVHIVFDDQYFEVDEGRTVLSVLLEQGYNIPNSCRGGICQTCMMQAVGGEVPVTSQAGLKDTLKVQGFFLACRCKPRSSLRLVDPLLNQRRCAATVVKRELLNIDVLRLYLKPTLGFSYHAGQFITIWKNDSTGRSYSLASVAALDEYLELHIRLIPDGQVSQWLYREVKDGDTLHIQQATGECFYTPGMSKQSLLLAGTGTGLAPLIGIARDALAQGHEGDIHLIHGAKQFEELYLHQVLLEMAIKHRHFYYHASVLSVSNLDRGISEKSLEQLVMDTVDNPKTWKIYLCGDQKIVNMMKKELFLAGASMNSIYADPFTGVSSE